MGTPSKRYEPLVLEGDVYPHTWSGDCIDDGSGEDDMDVDMVEFSATAIDGDHRLGPTYREMVDWFIRVKKRRLKNRTIRVTFEVLDG